MIRQRLIAITAVMLFVVSTQLIVNAQTQPIANCRKAVDSTPVNSTKRLDAMFKLTDAIRHHDLGSALAQANKTLELAQSLGDPDYVVVAKHDVSLIHELFYGKHKLPPELDPTRMAVAADAPPSLHVHYWEARLSRIIWRDIVTGNDLEYLLNRYREATQECEDPDLVLGQQAFDLYVTMNWLSRKATSAEVITLKDNLVAASQNATSNDAEIVVEIWNYAHARIQKNNAAALASINRALQLALAQGNRFYAIDCYRRLREFYRGNDAQESLRNNDLAWAEAKRLGAQRLICSSIGSAAGLYGQLGDKTLMIERLLELIKTPGFTELEKSSQQHWIDLIVAHYASVGNLKKRNHYRSMLLSQTELQQANLKRPDLALFDISNPNRIASNIPIKYQHLFPGNVPLTDQKDRLVNQIAKNAIATVDQANQDRNIALTNADVAKKNEQLATSNEKAALEQSSRATTVAIFALLGLLVLTLWVIIVATRNRMKRLSTELDIEKKNVDSLSMRITRLQRMESLGLMAGSVAHDFNNILVGVIGNAEILQMKNEAEKDEFIKQKINNIIKSAEKAASLSQQMLAYAGKQAISKQVANLNELVLQFESVLGSSCAESQSITLELDESPTVSKIDYTQVEQVLLNLVTNAAAASPRDGNIIIKTGTETIEYVDQDRFLHGTRSTGGDFCFIEVIDHGQGISGVDMERIFEPFFTSSELGRGLGLSVVYGVAEGHDGFIRCHSTVGKGTSLRVLFPMSKEPMPVTSPAAGSPARSSPRHVGKTILVIDDEENVMDLCRQLLQLFGYQVITALGGAAGIKIIEEDASAKIACVLMDVVMPEMGANELLQEMENQGINTPVVLMSGFSPVRLEFLLERPNVSSIIQKPFRAEEIREAIELAMGQHHPSSKLIEQNHPLRNPIPE